MAPQRQIRADYDDSHITVYQAYSSAIADPALAAGRFVPPFSFGRMTWVKPSYLWLMHRSNWARKPGQERVLAVRITRAGWERALAQAVLTGSPGLEGARVHVQWDPERSLRGAALNHYSIQVGVGRDVVRELVDEWTTGVADLTGRTRRIAALLQAGRAEQARRLLPPERPYPLPVAIATRLDAG
ncbi:DUF4291 domain-containing protein [Actinosynnema mirum]|uniref:DUF4291 domain-containing protein n=1 Tax=Actinosynnema mirum (strain ATCC 29888 / DSM 43827 / JCM 3225 / NBRC 14064 / NCIMB 13271 / NRRL B-12336 / IMRU 3971 / 101) TaxID=446462 RepID=C6WII0_ACTMD|nr:DUF4291 domain-containing protein [Actinosynnema mirum]ACU36223.1 conserved hypothetical protein [Actinosynnema mirum DSM 43827]